MGKWDITGLDGSISAEQVLLDWLKEPGNYQRFVQASKDVKKSGRGESKLDAVSEIPILLQQAGFEGFSTVAIMNKVNHLVQRYQQAHMMVTSGASTSLVQQVFCFYYDLASHIEGDTTRHSDSVQASSSSNFPQENDQRRSVSRNVKDEDSCRNNTNPNSPTNVYHPPENLSRLLELHYQHLDRILI